MARSFGSGNFYYLDGLTEITAKPVTMACWFYPTADGQRHELINIGNGTITGLYRIRWASHQTDDPVRISVSAITGVADSYSVPPPALNTWHHACGVWDTGTTNNIHSYLNGGNKDTGSNTEVPSAFSRIVLGKDYDLTSNGYAGRLADVAVWNAALTDAEVASLAKGVSPLFIRPSALVYYIPFLGPAIEVVSGRTLTEVGTVPLADHSPSRYYSRPQVAPSPLLLNPALKVGQPFQLLGERL